MNMRIKRYSVALGMSLGLALLAPTFFEGERLGLGFVLFTGLALTSLLWVKTLFGEALTTSHKALAATLLLFSLFLMFRFSFVLYLLNILGIGLILVAAYLHRGEAWNGEGGRSVTSWLLAPFQLIRPLVLSIFQLLKKSALPYIFRHGVNENIRSVVAGLLFAFPLLLVFGSLLVSADVRFENFVGDIVDIDIAAFFEWAFESLLFWPLTACCFLLGFAEKSKRYDYQASSRFDALASNGVQVSTILVCVNLLFLSYLFVQATYFFGGDQLVKQTEGVTYSSYARNGFFELVWVAAIALPTLIFCYWLVREEKKSLQVFVSALIAVMLVLIVIMEVSAAHRMLLYVRSYGLTELRFYSSVFMLFLVFALVLVYFLILKNNPERYANSLVGLVFIFIVLLNLVNPNARIAQYNLSQETVSKKDTYYLRELGIDALPQVLANIDYMLADERCLYMENMRYKIKDSDLWQEWNYSSQRAKHLIQENYEQLCGG